MMTSNLQQDWKLVQTFANADQQDQSSSLSCNSALDGGKPGAGSVAAPVRAQLYVPFT